ncbi:hypothetical protein BDP55DRAFT_661534 [Colletotrichum godetiae]|uniref:Secreted protein n=1 Tax=Colletotrichum godetiae TaxID=1209918 RepID=A0AAJ0EWQ4_9PEZI|nr:uncharacterized protein BDP55DRAFT_661534 [Colletotrichum godetiae]KAK1676583.1 hypothetical protein BDP55DRAFT_661534 [Colletotrichum godetiae]
MAGPGWFVWGGLMPFPSSAESKVYLLGCECVCVCVQLESLGKTRHGRSGSSRSSCFTFSSGFNLCRRWVSSSPSHRTCLPWPDPTARSLLMWHVLWRNSSTLGPLTPENGL